MNSITCNRIVAVVFLCGALIGTQASGETGLIDRTQALEARTNAVEADNTEQAAALSVLKVTPKIIAALTVKDGQLSTGSQGVRYDSKTGTVTFDNPEQLHFVPVVSDYVAGGAAYMTDKAYVRKITQPNGFIVWNTTLYTDGRGGLPISFTAIVVGYSKAE